MYKTKDENVTLNLVLPLAILVCLAMDNESLNNRVLQI